MNTASNLVNGHFGQMLQNEFDALYEEIQRDPRASVLPKIIMPKIISENTGLKSNSLRKYGLKLTNNFPERYADAENLIENSNEEDLGSHKDESGELMNTSADTGNLSKLKLLMKQKPQRQENKSKILLDSHKHAVVLNNSDSDSENKLKNNKNSKSKRLLRSSGRRKKVEVKPKHAVLILNKNSDSELEEETPEPVAAEQDVVDMPKGVLERISPSTSENTFGNGHIQRKAKSIEKIFNTNSENEVVKCKNTSKKEFTDKERSPNTGKNKTDMGVCSGDKTDSIIPTLQSQGTHTSELNDNNHLNCDQSDKILTTEENLADTRSDIENVYRTRGKEHSSDMNCRTTRSKTRNKSKEVETSQQQMSFTESVEEIKGNNHDCSAKKFTGNIKKKRGGQTGRLDDRNSESNTNTTSNKTNGTSKNAPQRTTHKKCATNVLSADAAGGFENRLEEFASVNRSLKVPLKECCFLLHKPKPLRKEVLRKALDIDKLWTHCRTQQGRNESKNLQVVQFWSKQRETFRPALENYIDFMKKKHTCKPRQKQPNKLLTQQRKRKSSDHSAHVDIKKIKMTDTSQISDDASLHNSGKKRCMTSKNRISSESKKNSHRKSNEKKMKLKGKNEIECAGHKKLKIKKDLGFKLNEQTNEKCQSRSKKKSKYKSSNIPVSKNKKSENGQVGGKNKKITCENKSGERQSWFECRLCSSDFKVRSELREHYIQVHSVSEDKAVSLTKTKTSKKTPKHCEPCEKKKVFLKPVEEITEGLKALDRMEQEALELMRQKLESNDERTVIFEEQNDSEEKTVEGDTMETSLSTDMYSDTSKENENLKRELRKRNKISSLFASHAGGVWQSIVTEK